MQDTPTEYPARLALPLRASDRYANDIDLLPGAVFDEVIAVYQTEHGGQFLYNWCLVDGEGCRVYVKDLDGYLVDETTWCAMVDAGEVAA